MSSIGHKKVSMIKCKKYKGGEIKMRGLSKRFMKDLKEGELKPLLDAVKKDDTLCLEIRENYINIYYRGGNICKVTEEDEKYLFFFDMKYTEKYKEEVPELLENGKVEEIVNNIPILKNEMDSYFSEHAKLEREFQQLILRENNCTPISRDTDYYIVDLEYANSDNNSRFDMIATKWLSTANSRKKGEALKLAFIEVKYGDGALTGNAGIQKHIKDLYKFLSKSENSIYEEAENVINQKIELGLIYKIKKDITVSKEKPEVILLCANHKPVKTALKREIREVMQTVEYKELKEMCDLKLATSSLMGYGLYDECMLSFEEFVSEE